MAKPRLHTSTARQWRRLKVAAQGMRRRPTEAEARLWSQLRGGHLGHRFRRQHAVGRFVVDFYCPAAALIVEVDGRIHEGQKGYDRARDTELAARGFGVLRFTNARVLSDTAAVVREIAAALEPHPPSPSP